MQAICLPCMVYFTLTLCGDEGMPFATTYNLGGWPMLSPPTKGGCPALLVFLARGRGF